MDDTAYDLIVIGSGVSGMAAAIIAAKEGEKVLVLEQHSIPGGLTQTYKREGLVFPTGVHCLGSLEPEQPLWYYFRYLSLLDKLSLVPLDQECFEKLYFPEAQFDIPTGRERYRQKLYEYFPDRISQIDRYFDQLKRIVDHVSMYNPAYTPENDLSMQFTAGLDDFFSQAGIDGELKSVLYANNPLYGLSSRECTLLTHFMISDSYLNSGFRIDEEKTPFADALVKSLEVSGGTIKVRSKVTQVLAENGKASGVKLDNGEQYQAQKVVYSGHPGRVLDICPAELFRPAYRKRLSGVVDSFGVFGVALAYDKEHCPVRTHDAYVYNTWDVDAHYTKTSVLDSDSAGMVFLSALPPGPDSDVCSVTALTGISDAEIMILKQYYEQSRDSLYEKSKALICEKMLHTLESAYPDIMEHARVVDTYSPMTFRRYTLTRNGSAYGIKKTADNFLEAMFNPVTRIRNFFLTGQSIAFSGIHGAIVSSVELCCAIYGKTYLMKKITGAGTIKE